SWRRKGSEVCAAPKSCEDCQGRQGRQGCRVYGKVSGSAAREDNFQLTDEGGWESITKGCGEVTGEGGRKGIAQGCCQVTSQSIRKDVGQGCCEGAREVHKGSGEGHFESIFQVSRKQLEAIGFQVRYENDFSCSGEIAREVSLETHFQSCRKA